MINEKLRKEKFACFKMSDGRMARVMVSAIKPCWDSLDIICVFYIPTLISPSLEEQSPLLRPKTDLPVLGVVR